MLTLKVTAAEYGYPLGCDMFRRVLSTVKRRIVWLFGLRGRHGVPAFLFYAFWHDIDLAFATVLCTRNSNHPQRLMP